MREQDEISERELSKMEIINLPDKEFKVTVLNMLVGFERKVDELSECFKKDKENVKKELSKLKNPISEKKTTPEGVNSRADDAEQVSNPRDRAAGSN